MEWFAVRHLIQNGPNFEERITIWHCLSADLAIKAAQDEAAEYVRALHDGHVLDLFQAYRMFDVPENGSEVFSLIRSSELSSTEYIDRFFATGDEFQADT